MADQDREDAPPTQRIERMAKIGRLVAGQSARAAGGRLADRARSADGRRAAESKRYARIAEEVVDQLGQMKGAAMKIGQVVASIDFPMLDEEDNARLKAKLGELRDQAPRVGFRQMEKLMQSEWGENPSRMFAELDPEAAAAASIGQVYKGVTHEGRTVAIKVQYPGIAEAVDADMRAAQLLLPLLKRLAPGLDGRALLAELRERIAEETDYEIEAQNQRRLHRAWRDHPHVLVPGVDTELSTRRVLVTDWVDAEPFAAMQAKDDAERDRIGEVMYRFFWATALEQGTALGDPHPGNMMLNADGRLVMIDFGLLRSLPPQMLVAEGEAYRSVVAGDADRLKTAMHGLGYVKSDIDAEAFYDYMRLTGSWVWDVEQPFRLSGQYAQRLGAELLRQQGSWDIVRSLSVPGEALLLRRMENLVFTVLCDLRAAADWKALSDELRGGEEARTELGKEHAAWRESRGARTAA